MDGLAKIFPFVRNFIVKVLGVIQHDSSDENSWNSAINTPAGLINLFILLVMVASIIVLILGCIFFATRNLDFSGSESSTNMTTRRRRYIACFWAGGIFLSLPLLTMIAIAIAGAALPSSIAS